MDYLLKYMFDTNMLHQTLDIKSETIIKKLKKILKEIKLL